MFHVPKNALLLLTYSSIYLLSLFLFDENRSLYANLPIADIPSINRRTIFAGAEIFHVKNSSYALPNTIVGEPDTADASIPAAFRKLKMGNFSGKTPGDLLLEADDVKKVRENLLQQAGFLEGKLKDYPQNQLQINAINDAIQAYDDGTLAGSKPTVMEELVDENVGVTYEIYKTPIKHQKKINSDGKHECYSVYISCSPAKQYPYKIEIMNCNAPLIRIRNGLMPPDMARADSIKKENIELKEEEWEYILDWINSNIALTRNLWYPELREKDEANRWKGYQN